MKLLLVLTICCVMAVLHAGTIPKCSTNMTKKKCMGPNNEFPVCDKAIKSWMTCKCEADEFCDHQAADGKCTFHCKKQTVHSGSIDNYAESNLFAGDVAKS